MHTYHILAHIKLCLAAAKAPTGFYCQVPRNTTNVAKKLRLYSRNIWKGEIW